MILIEDTLTKQNLAACNRLLYVTKETSCDTEISIITVNVLIDSIRIYLSSTLDTSPRSQEIGFTRVT